MGFASDLGRGGDVELYHVGCVSVLDELESLFLDLSLEDFYWFVVMHSPDLELEHGVSPSSFWGRPPCGLGHIDVPPSYAQRILRIIVWISRLNLSFVADGGCECFWGRAGKGGIVFGVWWDL